MATIDFSNVSSGFEELEPGTYIARVAKIEEKKSQNGNPYLNWELDIQGDNSNRKAWYITSLLPQALWNLKATLKDAFGFTDEELSSSTFEMSQIFDLVGQECAAILEPDTYNGKVRTKCTSLQNVAVAESLASGLL